MSWMRKLNDDERTAQAVEIKPGLMASPWERGTCAHGRAYPFRWTWHPAHGETVEDGEPEMGANGCKKCNKEPA